MRKFYFVPGYVEKRQRKMIFGHKHKQLLQDNPQIVEIGRERIRLESLDRGRNLPNRTKLVRQALRLMEQGQASDWSNLVSLLAGLKHLKATPDAQLMDTIIRKALLSRQMPVVFQCLYKSDQTGVTLKRDEVLRQIIWDLHRRPQLASWQEGATASALKHSRVVADLLETEEHGPGRHVAVNDPRQRPEVLGAYLELAAVYAYKHGEAKDGDGRVKASADRLLSCIEAKPEILKPRRWTPPEVGPVEEALDSVPIWHGLRLAQSILGRDMPHAQLAERIASEFESGLQRLIDSIAEKQPEKGTYGDQAISMWETCIRP